MRIAVIIPTWNEAHHVLAAIESAWKAGAGEVIVVDGGSCDDTLQQARGRASQVLVTTRGRGHQQNYGAAATDAEWLIFLHADNRLASTAIQQLQAAITSRHIACGAFRQCIEATGPLYRLLELGNALRVRWWGVPFGDQAIFVQRGLFQSTSGFPETPLMEDYILMRRMRRRAWPILLDGPVYVSARRWQQSGIVLQTLRNWTIIALYRLGVSTQTLARMYYRQNSESKSDPCQTTAIANAPQERPR